MTNLERTYSFGITKFSSHYFLWRLRFFCIYLVRRQEYIVVFWKLILQDQVRIILTSRSAIKVFNDLLNLIQLDSSPDESQIISQEHLIHSPLVLDYIKANHGHHLFQSDVSNYSTNQSSCCLNDSFILNCDFLRILAI